jgi:branched-chain amino acid aminotransferase
VAGAAASSAWTITSTASRPAWPRIPAASADSGIKNHHGLDFVMGLFAACERGGETVALLDADGHVTEGPGFKFFASQLAHGVERDRSRDARHAPARGAWRQRSPDRARAQSGRRQAVLVGPVAPAHVADKAVEDIRYRRRRHRLDGGGRDGPTARQARRGQIERALHMPDDVSKSAGRQPEK